MSLNVSMRSGFDRKESMTVISFIDSSDRYPIRRGVGELFFQLDFRLAQKVLKSSLLFQIFGQQLN